MPQRFVNYQTPFFIVVCWAVIDAWAEQIELMYACWKILGPIHRKLLCKRSSIPPPFFSKLALCCIRKSSKIYEEVIHYPFFSRAAIFS